MKIALTVWGDRISPVFDAATTLLLVDIANGGVRSRQFAPFDPARPSQFAEMLKQMDVSTLVCGAISEGHAHRISIGGVKLMSFVSGQTERILAVLASGKPIIPTFLMPGCGRRHRGGNDRYPYFNQSKEEMNMPKGDGTGPTGQGPGAGRNRGQCKTGTKDGTGKGRGKGRGRGSTNGSGQGQGQRKNK